MQLSDTLPPGVDNLFVFNGDIVLGSTFYVHFDKQKISFSNWVELPTKLMINLEQILIFAGVLTGLLILVFCLVCCSKKRPATNNHREILFKHVSINEPME